MCGGGVRIATLTVQRQHSATLRADRNLGDVLKLVDLPWMEDELVIEEFGEQMPFSTWVGVERMEIPSRWRGLRIGYAAMREVVRSYGAGDNTLITVRPHPLMTDASGCCHGDSTSMLASASAKRFVNQGTAIDLDPVAPTPAFTNSSRRRGSGAHS